MVVIKDSVSFQLHSETSDPDDRYLIIVCDIIATRYTLVNVYIPNFHQVRFLNKLLKKLNGIQQGSLVICGDFNITPDLDSTSVTSNRSPSLAFFL